MGLTDLAKERLANDNGFVKCNGYSVIKVEEHYCEMEAVISDSSKNPFGIAHGGFIFGLADTAAGVAAMTDERMAVTVNSSIDYLKPGKGDKLIAKASVVKAGKAISVVDVLIYDSSLELISKATVTYFYIDYTLN